MSRKSVSFNESKIEIREIPRNRTIEINQRLKNLVSRTKKTLKKRFPNGIEPLNDEKTELEELSNSNKPITMRQLKRIDEIDEENIRYENLKYIIKNPKDYIKYLDKENEKSGRTESKIEKRLRLSIKNSPITINTSTNSIINEKVSITKKNKSKGGKKNHTKRRTSSSYDSEGMNPLAFHNLTRKL